MRETLKFITILLLITLIITACAHQSYIRKDFSFSPQFKIKVVRYVTPTLMYTTYEGVVVGGVIGGGFLGGLLIGAMYEDAGKKLSEEVGLPDFGKLVAERLVESIKNEFPNWPQMILEEVPITEEIKNLNSDLLLEIKMHAISFIYKPFTNIYGLETYTLVKMRDQQGNLLWQRLYHYRSKDFNRLKPLSEWLSQGGKPLIEELEYAADKTVEDFINHLKSNWK